MLSVVKKRERTEVFTFAAGCWPLRLASKETQQSSPEYLLAPLSLVPTPWLHKVDAAVGTLREPPRRQQRRPASHSSKWP